MTVKKDRRPRLTLPARGDPGSCYIAVDGVRVGHVLETYYAWTAYLWPCPRHWDASCEQLTRPKLGDLREALKERLDKRGPWWGA